MSLVIVKLILMFSSFTLTAVIFQLIRHRKLREEYSLIWLLTGIVLFLIACFGGVMIHQLIAYVGIFLLLSIILSQSVCLSKNADCIRDLAQHAALLEFRLAQLEAKKAPDLGLNGTRTNGSASTKVASPESKIIVENGRNGVNEYAA